MKMYSSILLATVIYFFLYSQQTIATNFTSQCLSSVSNRNCPLLQKDTNHLSVTVNADYAKGLYPKRTTFTGNVNVNQGNNCLRADEVQIYQKQHENSHNPTWIASALGNVYYYNNQIILKGSKGLINLNTKDANIWKGEYQMVGRQGRGKADLMKQRNKNQYIILDNASFTSCPPGSNTWSIVGSKIIHDRKEQVIKVWNARFKLGQIPIFYSPYLKIPVGDKRYSGFLIPNAKYSTSNYFEFYLPYYWSITPNMDATIIPHYIYKLSNVIWRNEFRYLTYAGSGQMELDYLSSKKVFKDIYPIKNKYHYWLFCWQHVGALNQKWRFNINYTKVNDPYYFNEINSKYDFGIHGYTTQKCSICYIIDDFDATISTKQFQIFNHKSNNSYAAKPQLDVNWYLNNIKLFNIHIYAQGVHFTNTNPNMPESIRLHLEPTISLPIVIKNCTNLNTEIKIMATHYQQKNLDWYNAVHNNTLKDSINRILPQFKMDSKLIYNRPIKWANGYIQILEPRMQYLYVPYYNQSKIQNYDSSFLQSDYSGLFRNYLYSGLDRIASVNRLTTGITTRIYDSMAVERFSISIGENYHFSGYRTGDDVIQRKRNDKIGSLILAGDTYWRINDHWGIRGNLQYNIRLNNLETSSSAIEYRYDDNRMMQLNYRYASPKYVSTVLPNCISIEKHKEGISQIGSIASWPIGDRWSIVGSYYFDSNTNKTADQMVCMQYNSCCYAIRVGYERKINSWNIDNNQIKYNKAICFNIELRGLNSNYYLDTQQMLRSNILPYRSLL